MCYIYSRNAECVVAAGLEIAELGWGEPSTDGEIPLGEASYSRAGATAQAEGDETS